MTIQKIALAPIKDKRHAESVRVAEDALATSGAHIHQETFLPDIDEVQKAAFVPSPSQVQRNALAADIAHVQKELPEDPLRDEAFVTDVHRMSREAFAALATHVHRAVPTVSGEVEVAEPKAKKKGWVNTAFRFGVTILLFAFLFKNIDFAKLWSTLFQINPSIALVGLVIGFCTLVVSGYQWQTSLNAEKIHFDLAKLINLYMVGIAFSHFLPSSMGGDVVKAYYVGRESNNMPGSASAAVMSRVTGFFGMVVVAYIALIFFHQQFTRDVVALLLVLSLIVLSMIAGTFVFATLFARFAQAKKIQTRIESIMPAFLGKKIKLGSILDKAVDIGTTLIISAKKPRPMVVATLFGVMFHITACLNYYSYGLAMHLDVPFYFYLVAIPLVSLVAFLPISIGGFGVRESTLIFIFGTIHVLAPTALTLAFMVDIQTLFFGVVGGCMYLFMSSLLGSQKKPSLT